MTDRSFIDRLWKELPGLVEAGVVDAETADRIRLHYGEGARSGHASLMLAFSVLGALLIGGGVILLIAHNWDELPRYVRAAISFAPLLLSQALVLSVIGSEGRRGSASWREGAGISWHLGVAASIALISQTYNLGGTVQDFLLVWAFLSLPIAYLADSVGGALLSLLVAASWRMEAFSGDAQFHWQLWLLAGATIPFAIRQFRKNPSGPGFALVSWGYLFVIGAWSLPLLAAAGRFYPFLLFSIAAALYLAGRLFVPAEGTHRLRSPLAPVAGGVLLLMLLILSYSTLWDKLDMPHLARRGGLEAVLALALAALSWLFCLYRAWRTGDRESLLLGSAPLAIGAATALIWLDPGGEASAVVVNLFGLGVGVAMVVTGSREGRFRKVNGGMFLVGALAFLRFVDSSQGILPRAVALILIGVAFLLVNRRLARRVGRTP